VKSPNFCAVKIAHRSSCQSLNQIRSFIAQMANINRDVIPIYVKGLTGFSKRIWVNKQEPISSLQWPVYAVFGVEPDSQRYIYCGKAI
jgi:hypothetical protein